MTRLWSGASKREIGTEMKTDKSTRDEGTEGRVEKKRQRQTSIPKGI